jgi:transcriptional regulator with XRE-family HTH domain/Tfp pilus assembly protein PilF
VTDTADLGTWLRSCRKSAGLSQEELAERAGLSVRAVRNLERGRTDRPHSGSLSRLADALSLQGQARADLLELGQQRAGAAANGTTRQGAATGTGLIVPRQLPASVRRFAGRERELALLTGLLGQAGARPAAAVISAIGGTPGVGKTTLAVHFGHQTAGLFPDGQLYVNLAGFGPSGSPLAPGQAVRGFLGALGIRPEQIPPGLDGQAGLFRSLLAGRRMLVVLDNVVDEEQVRPLLPGSPGCLVVVTSRRQLTGLAVAEGAALITLDCLPEAEALQLLAGRLGAGRVDAEPEAAGDLVTLCGGLPLALAIAAARAAARPGFPLADLAAEMRQADSRLDGLDARAPGASIRPVFSWSFQALSQPAARMFRLLGVHPGPDVSVPAAASLAGLGHQAARALLDELIQASLLSEYRPGRYTLHDLLRAYAAEQALTTGGGEHRTATDRLLDHYLHTSHAAAVLLNPHRTSVLPLTQPRPDVTPEHLDGHQQALAWFETEHQVLLGCVSIAAETGSDVCAWILPWAMTEFLDRRGHWHEWAATQRTALEAATRLGDLAGQAVAHRAIATACVRLTDYRQARTHLAACLRLRRQLGDCAGEALARHSLGRVAEQQGRYADALRHDQQALALFREAGDDAGQALALNAIGWYHNLLGRPEQARTFCQQALALYRHTVSVGQAQAWDSLGYAEHQLGRLDQATVCYQRALGIFRDLGELFGQADTLDRLGDTRAAAEDLPAARNAWQQALDILDDLGHHDATRLRAKLATSQR